MSGYFKPLRRKLGVVTLVVACLFTGGWLRSSSTPDYVRFFPLLQSGVVVISENQRTMIQVWSGAIDADRKTESRRKIKTLPSRVEVFGIHLNERVTTRAGLGSGFTLLFQPEQRMFRLLGEFTIPYWTISLPLTLISAYLLFSRPRRKNPKPSSEA